jgi:hypothetical protein
MVVDLKRMVGGGCSSAVLQIGNSGGCAHESLSLFVAGWEEF